MFLKSSVFIVMLVVLTVTVSAAKNKRGKKGKATSDTDEEIAKLTERITKLEAGSNVHFFFHGDEDHDHDHTEKDQHVHIDLHINGHDDHETHQEHFHHEHVAVCAMSDSGVVGSVVMIQADHDRSANFQFKFDHLGKGNTEHKIHVHQFGVVSDNCNKIGGHYDPYHEGVDVGDLGTISTDENGAVAETWKNNTHLTLFDQYSVVGRSIMVHDEDGKGLACCAIGWSPETHDHDMSHSHGHDHSGHAHDHSGHGHDHSADNHAHSEHDHDHSGHSH